MTIIYPHAPEAPPGSGPGRAGSQGAIRMVLGSGGSSTVGWAQSGTCRVGTERADKPHADQSCTLVLGTQSPRTRRANACRERWTDRGTGSAQPQDRPVCSRSAPGFHPLLCPWMDGRTDGPGQSTPGMELQPYSSWPGGEARLRAEQDAPSTAPAAGTHPAPGRG